MPVRRSHSHIISFVNKTMFTMEEVAREKLRCVELYSGIGGMHCALQGFTTVLITFFITWEYQTTENLNVYSYGRLSLTVA